MKSIITVLLFSLVAQLPINAQDNTQSKDKDAASKAVLSYITNFFINDYEKMEVVLHERLSKRGINPDGNLSEDYSKEDLKALMSNKQPLPLEYQKNEIISVEIYDRVARVVLLTGYPKTKWKEYIHLAKIDGEWIIADVFWCFLDIKD